MAKQEVQLRFDYGSVPEEHRAFVIERTERIHNLARMTATGIVQIGQYLTEVKDRLRHGQFLEWIEREFAWKQRTAYRFMGVYRNVKVANLANLEIDVSALYLIAEPSTPEPVRDEIIRRGENGERIKYTGVRAVVEEFQQTGILPDVAVDLARVIEARRARTQPPKTAPVKPTRAEREETDRRRAEVQANTARVAGIMSVIQAIEMIAKCEFPTEQIAYTIRRYDSPDKDWHGKVGEARVWLDGLKELLL
jgi:hypothetical protein